MKRVKREEGGDSEQIHHNTSNGEKSQVARFIVEANEWRHP